MSIISCYKPMCNRHIKVSCNCTSPETYSCNKHLAKHFNSSSKPHYISSIFLEPAEGTKEAILNFLTEQKHKNDAIKNKIVTSFYHTLCNYQNALKEILKEIDSNSTQISQYFDKVWKTKKLSKFKKDSILNLLALQPDEAIEKAKTIFPENKNIELFNNMINSFIQAIFIFNEETFKATRSKNAFSLEISNFNIVKESRNIQQLLAEYKELIKTDPNNDNAYNKIGNLLCNEKKYEKSIKYYNKAIIINPNIAIYYTNKGNTLKELDRTEEAQECYEQAIKINPNEDKACIGIGNIFYKKCKYEQAIKYYNDAIRINPHKSFYYSKKGDAFIHLDRKEEAMECYTEAIKINPNNDVADMGIGNILSYKLRYEEALIYYDNAIRVNPTNKYYYENKGNALRELGRIKEAEDCFKKADIIKNTS